MAKRFIDTDLFRKPFMRSMEAPYKALWIYLLCECDHAGIWVVELDVAQLRMGLKLDPEKVLEKMQGAVVAVDDGRKWYLPDFVTFQYGTLNPENRVHASVISRLEALGIDPLERPENKPLTSPLQGAKDKYKDKDKDKELEEEIPTARARTRARNGNWSKEEFAKACRAAVDANPDLLPNAEHKPFFDYWTEANPSTGKMRFQGEKFFDVARRMGTWSRNNFGKAKEAAPSTTWNARD